MMFHSWMSNRVGRGRYLSVVSMRTASFASSFCQSGSESISSGSASLSESDSSEINRTSPVSRSRKGNKESDCSSRASMRSSSTAEVVMVVKSPPPSECIENYMIGSAVLSSEIVPVPLFRKLASWWLLLKRFVSGAVHHPLYARMDSSHQSHCCAFL